MNIKKLIAKYLILLLLYIIIVRFLEPYGMNLYYSLIENPNLGQSEFQVFQTVLTISNFFISLLIVIFMLVDTKAKKFVDWLIFVLTFFSPEAGISIFIVWKIYNEINKYEAQQTI